MATDLQRELKETYQGTCTLKSNFECRHLGESSQYNSNCCSEIKPCGIGEGGCSDDAHCMNNLECGTNNCGIPGRSDTRCCRTPWNRPGKQYYHDLNTLFHLFTNSKDKSRDNVFIIQNVLQYLADGVTGRL